MQQTHRGRSYREQLDALRCRGTEWLRSRRTELIAEQRRLHLEELAVLKVLDERDALGRMPDASVSSRTSKANLAMARSLETLPAVAETMASGALSAEQLAPLTELATPETDREWAARGPNISPADLQALARRRQAVTLADARARRAARMLRTWREPEAGMTGGRFRLADLDGILVEKVLDHRAEQMRPTKGEAWDTLEHRKADALVDLCRTYADAELTGKYKEQIVIHRRADGSADCEGMQLAVEIVDAVTPNAKVKDRVDDAHGQPLHSTNTRSALPRKLEQHVIERDPHCRVPGCTNTHGLQIHHLVPCCHGGDDGIDNLARVCPYHHRMLTPHGPWHLVGDPNQIDGLRLVHEDDLIDARAGPAPRAGP
ncbi:MAG: HNH endonuclease signature motif containing protein [Acidimicrobiia bacterium]